MDFVKGLEEAYQMERLLEGLKGIETTGIETVATADCAKRPQVSGEIDRIQKSLEILCKVVEELEIRLASVLRQPDPILAEKDESSKTLVPLAEAIRTINDTIMHQYRRIANIIDRVEL